MFSFNSLIGSFLYSRYRKYFFSIIDYHSSLFKHIPYVSRILDSIKSDVMVIYTHEKSNILEDFKIDTKLREKYITSDKYIEHIRPSITIQNRINELVRVYGTLRNVAKVTGINPGNLSRLRSGKQTNIDDITVKALGLKKIVRYEYSDK